MHRKNYETPAHVGTFKSDMDSNPLDDDPLVKQVGGERDGFIAEYYPDGIASEKLQVWRPKERHEDHWRRWVMVCNYEHVDGGLREIYDSLTVDKIEQLPREHTYPHKDD